MCKSPVRILCALICAVLLFSCSRQEADHLPNRRVVLFYAAAFSNLSSSISADIDEFCAGGLPYVGNSDVFLVYSHMPARYGKYDPTHPVLFRAYKGPDGSVCRDTLIVYPDTDVSSSAEVMRKVLTDVKDNFPASSYGMIFSSHAKGWIPPGYEEKSNSIWSVGAPRKEYPLTRELGTENVDGSGIDIIDLPDAIPMHLDFFIMDACLMGCVEVAYEIKDKCDILLFSPTEILASGMPYTTMPPKLLNTVEPDILGIAREFYEMYDAQSGLLRSATVTVVDCRKLDPLADCFRDIVSVHRDEFDNAPRSQVQPYFYNEYHWFFDLRDLLVEAGATQEELQRLDKALDDCVTYKAATDKFFDLKLETVCGLSVYFPIPDNTELNNYYKTLAWNQTTGLIR
ncbi:MAG: hypothetical protein J6S97_01515 [Bacteroidales bacterium]|nr:hypothetical protein [Bacteroidales bacterium]